MKTLRLLLVLLSLGVAGAIRADDLTVEKTVLDIEGTPLAGILIRAKPQEGNTAAAQTTRTDAQGGFSFSLCAAPWLIEVDARELLERGYFCEPDWDPFGPDRPLTVVPLRPELSYEVAEGRVTLAADFDWLPGLRPTATRLCRVERSEDFVTWESIGTIALANPPILLEDPKGQVTHCIYRVVDLGLSVVNNPLEP